MMLMEDLLSFSSCNNRHSQVQPTLTYTLHRVRADERRCFDLISNINLYN